MTEDQIERRFQKLEDRVFELEIEKDILENKIYDLKSQCSKLEDDITDIMRTVDRLA
jgi:predicted  nucleic acid-binding Zn-ribbon protein